MLLFSCLTWLWAKVTVKRKRRSTYIFRHEEYLLNRQVFLVFLTTFLSIKLYIFKTKALKENFLEKKQCICKILSDFGLFAKSLLFWVRKSFYKNFPSHKWFYNIFTNEIKNKVWKLPQLYKTTIICYNRISE